MTTSDPVVIRQSDASVFYEGPELCREYFRNEAMWFGSSLVNPGAEVVKPVETRSR